MIALACDHAGFELKQDIIAYFEKLGIECKDFGTYSADRCDYPIYAIPAARAVASGECEKGVFICGTGVGMSIVSNKIAGVRAALCRDIFTAEMTRKHNDANVLALGARVTENALALDIVKTFFSTDFEGGQHTIRVNMLNELDSAR